MTSFKCPVCGKTGISDYLNNNVTCPNCNSDLGIYRTIHTISESNEDAINKVKRFKILSIVLPLLAILLLGTFAFLYINREKKEHTQILAEKNTLVVELKDSINKLSKPIVSSKDKNVQDSSNYIEYTVVSNDSPWRIVHKFYGDCKDWDTISQKIAEANNIWDDSTSTWKPIHPGQVIKIYYMN